MKKLIAKRSVLYLGRMYEPTALDITRMKSAAI